MVTTESEELAKPETETKSILKTTSNQQESFYKRSEARTVGFKFEEPEETKQAGHGMNSTAKKPSETQQFTEEVAALAEPNQRPLPVLGPGVYQL